MLSGKARQWSTVLLAAVALSGCMNLPDTGDPPEPPTAADLSRIVARTQQPAYWLGPRFRGLDISAATVTRSRVSLTYGPWSCDSGCVDSGGVFTSRRDVRLSREDFSDRIDTRDCWTRIGKAVAVLIGCLPDGYPQEMLIFSGSREILVTSLYTRDGQGEISVETVLRRLRPLNANAPWPLPRPKRLSCRQLTRVDKRYRRHMPPALRPASDC